MKKIKLAAMTMIITAFIMKTYRKFKQRPEDSKRELHETLLHEKILADKRRAYEEQKRQLDAMAPCDSDLAVISRYCGEQLVAPKGCAIGTCNR